LLIVDQIDTTGSLKATINLKRSWC